ncbi:DUF1269 domain-containing protein [Ilumatobacter coccineus]|uniref:DUF1269 domain-containing protein n=1 Tax=Ilumatobacter coccineus TaxID=467094 RepID=UPI0003470581|nr:DUF1269 domain-containing protein [Ilumatobacter coccineus]
MIDDKSDARRANRTADGYTLCMTDDSTTSPAPFDPPDPSLRAGLADDHRAVSDPDAPVIIGVSFDSALKAQEYLLAMGRLRQDGALDLKDAVTVTKNDDGKVMVTETIDPTPGRAAASGAMWTGLLGLVVGGPIGWIAGLGLGAGAGAVAAKVVDLGIPDEWVDWFKAAVEPGTSTIVILAEHVHVRALAEEARRFRGAELLYTSMSDSAMEQLDEAFSGD